MQARRRAGPVKAVLLCLVAVVVLSGRLVMCAGTLVCRLVFGEPESVVVERVSLPSGAWCTATTQEPLRIVFLSDFHHKGVTSILRCTNQRLLDHMVQQVNLLDADLVVLGGDFIDDGYDLDSARRHIEELSSKWLSRLRARMGMVAVLGNHDHKGGGSDEIVAQALRQSANATVLRNESMTIEMRGKMVVEIVGMDGGRRGMNFSRESLEGLREPRDDTCLTIVVAHKPDSATSISEGLKREWPVLQLSGHTHGGQVVVPGKGPVLPLLARKAWPLSLMFRRWLNSVNNWTWSEGLHFLRAPPLPNPFTLYVTRGIGTHPPLRLHCPPEVTLIEM